MSPSAAGPVAVWSVTTALWLLVQHADHDPAFQRTCLELLGQAVQAGEADARQQAYLTDRVLLAEGNP